MLSSEASVGGSLLRTQTYTNQANFANIRIMDSKINGIYNANNNSALTTSTSACTGTAVCSGTNVVKFVKLIFIGNNYTLSTQSYLIVGRLQWNNEHPFYTNIGYSYEFIESLTNPASTSLATYTLGSPLQLVKRITVTGSDD